MKTVLKGLLALVMMCGVAVCSWATEPVAAWLNFEGLTAENSLAPQISAELSGIDGNAWRFNLAGGEVNTDKSLQTKGNRAPYITCGTGLNIGYSNEPVTILMAIEAPLTPQENKPILSAQALTGDNGAGFATTSATDVTQIKGTLGGSIYTNSDQLTCTGLDASTGTIYLAISMFNNGKGTSLKVVTPGESGTRDWSNITNLFVDDYAINNLYFGNFRDGTEGGLDYKLKGVVVYPTSLADDTTLLAGVKLLSTYTWTNEKQSQNSSGQPTQSGTAYYNAFTMTLPATADLANDDVVRLTSITLGSRSGISDSDFNASLQSKLYVYSANAAVSAVPEADRNYSGKVSTTTQEGPAFLVSTATTANNNSRRSVRFLFEKPLLLTVGHQYRLLVVNNEYQAFTLGDKTFPIAEVENGDQVISRGDNTWAPGYQIVCKSADTLSIAANETLVVDEALASLITSVGDGATLIASAGSIIDLSHATFGTGVTLKVDVSAGGVLGAMSSPFTLPEGVTVTYAMEGTLPSSVLAFDTTTGAITENVTSLGYELTWMPIGDSITEGEKDMGVGSNGDGGSGYRYHLWKALEDGGQSTRTVGFRRSHRGKVEDPATTKWAYHSALYSGTIQPLASLARGAQMYNVETALENAGYPDVISVLLGINDLHESLISGLTFENDTARATAVFNEWVKLVQKIAANRPNSKIVVSTLLPVDNTGTDARRKAFNTLVRNAYDTKAAPFGNENVILIDVCKLAFNDVRDGTCFKDWAHPNPKGSARVAKAFRLGMLEALKAIQKDALKVVHVHNGAEGQITVRLNKKPDTFTSATLTVGSETFNTTTIAENEPVLTFDTTGKTVALGTTTATLTLGSETLTATHVEILGSGALENVPASFREGFVPYSTITIGNNSGASGDDNADTINYASNLADTTTIRRVGYYVELKRAGLPALFVWVSMDADKFQNLLGNVGLPGDKNNNVYQGYVDNLKVFGNRGNFEHEVTDEGVQGWVEFTPYGWSSTDLTTDAPREGKPGCFGWNDTLNSSGNYYGCMQVARILRSNEEASWNAPAAEMLFAYNQFKTSDARVLGIGSLSANRSDLNDSEQSAVYDWTYVVNHLGYEDYEPSAYVVKKIEIWVEESALARVGETSYSDFDAAVEAAAAAENKTVTLLRDYTLTGVITDGVQVEIAANVTLTLGLGSYATAFSGEGAIAIAENAEVTLSGDNTYADGTTIPATATVTMTNAQSLGGGAVTGTGTVQMCDAEMGGDQNNTPQNLRLSDALFKESSGWEGTFRLKNIGANWIDFSLLGNSASTLALDNVTGYLVQNVTYTFATVKIEAGGWKVTNGNAGKFTTFAGELTGTGDITVGKGTDSTYRLIFTDKDTTGFDGAVTITDGANRAWCVRFGNGEHAAGFVIATDHKVNVASDKTWCVATSNAESLFRVEGTLAGTGSIQGPVVFASGATLEVASEGCLTADVRWPASGTVNIKFGSAPTEDTIVVQGENLPLPASYTLVNADGSPLSGYYLTSTTDGLAVTTTEPTIVAKVNGMNYISLQAAVDAAGANGTVTIVKKDLTEETLDLSNGAKLTFEGEGSLTVGTLTVGTNRDFMPEGVAADKLTVTTLLHMTEGRTENDIIPLTWMMGEGAEIQIERLNGDTVSSTDTNSIIEVQTNDNGSKQIYYPTTLTKNGAWYEWTFDEETLTGTGWTKAELTNVSGNATEGTIAYVSLEDTSPARKALDLTQAQPWLNSISYPADSDWAATFYAKMPTTEGAVLIGFGSTKDTSHGAIALVRGLAEEKTQVLLVYIHPRGTGTPFTILSEMSVSHPTTAYHLYTFVVRRAASGGTIEVYCDNEKLITYEGDVDVADGVQVGSVLNGFTSWVGDTGRFTRVIGSDSLTLTTAGGTSNSNAAAIDMLRIYDCELSEREVQRTIEEGYRYESTEDAWTRTIETVTAGATDWTSADWLQNDVATDATEPSGGNVTINNQTGAKVTVAMAPVTENLILETLTLEGAEIVLEAPTTGAVNPITVSGVTTIKTTATIDTASIHLAGPIHLENNPTLTLEVSPTILTDMIIEVLANGAPAKKFLTGRVSGAGTINGTMPNAEVLPAEWNLRTYLDVATQQYVAEVSHNPWFIEVAEDEVTWMVTIHEGTDDEKNVELSRTTEGASDVPLNLAGCKVTLSGKGAFTLPGGHTPKVTIVGDIDLSLTTEMVTTYPTGDNPEEVENPVTVIVPLTKIDAIEIVEGGDLSLATGTYDIPMTGAGTFTVEGGREITVGSANFLGMTTLSGTGTLIYGSSAYGYLPTTTAASKFTNATWCGTVKLDGINNRGNNLHLDAYGNANSIIALKGVVGDLSSGLNVPAAIELVDEEETVGFQLDNGSSGGSHSITFAKVTGSGTFKGPTTSNFGYLIQIEDASEFTGTLDLDGQAKSDSDTTQTSQDFAVVIGNRAATRNDKGKIVISGTTAEVAATWSTLRGVVVEENATLKGTGTIEGAVTFEDGASLSALQATDCLTVTGAVSFTEGSTLHIHVPTAEVTTARTVLDGTATPENKPTVVVYYGDGTDAKTALTGTWGKGDALGDLIVTVPQAPTVPAITTVPEGSTAETLSEATKVAILAAATETENAGITEITKVVVTGTSGTVSESATYSVEAADLFTNVVFVEPDTSTSETTDGIATIAYDFGIERLTVKTIDGVPYVVLKATVSNSADLVDNTADYATDTDVRVTINIPSGTVPEVYPMTADDMNTIGETVEKGAKWFKVGFSTLENLGTYSFKVHAAPKTSPSAE